LKHNMQQTESPCKTILGSEQITVMLSRELNREPNTDR